MSQNEISDPGTALPSQSSPPPSPAAGRAVLELWFAGVVALAIALGGIYTYWLARDSYLAQFGPLAGLAAAGAASTPPVLDPRAAWGQYGDFMGGAVNPVLGLLTLLALVATVWLQLRQLAMSRQAMADAQHEMRQAEHERRETAKAMKDQLEQARLTAEAQAVAATYQILAKALGIATHQIQENNKHFETGGMIGKNEQEICKRRDDLNRYRDRLVEAIEGAAMQFLKSKEEPDGTRQPR